MSKKVILIIDDAKTVRTLAKLTLNKSNFEVVEAEDGNEGLEKVKQNKIDLILLDLNMPNKNGFEFMAEFRQTPDFGNIPVFMMTTESAHTKASEAKKLGIKAWIVKPFVPHQLIGAIKKVLGIE